MFEPLDGPSSQLKVSVTSSTVVEAKTGSTPFSDRKVVTIQPDRDIYVYFGNGSSVPDATAVATHGIRHFKDAKETYECGERQPLFLLALSTTANVVVIERA